VRRSHGRLCARPREWAAVWQMPSLVEDAVTTDNAPPARRVVNQFRRLDCRSVDFDLCAGPSNEATHRMTVCLAYDDKGILRELNIVSRGKIGQGLDLALHDLGIKLSRAIQDRDPDTGDP
jgi:hypothetical protein